MRISFFGKSKIFLQAQEFLIQLNDVFLQVFVHIF